MIKIRNYRSKTKSLLILISIFCSIFIFNYVFNEKNNQVTKFVIDKETKIINSKFNGVDIICGVKSDVSECQERKTNKNILLFGNSQLNGINQIKENDFITSYYLKKKYDKIDTNFITYALPNGSITEFLVLYEYIISEIKIDKLVFALVFDDLREHKIRLDIQTLLKQKDLEAKFNTNSHRKKILKKISKNSITLKKYNTSVSFQDKIEIKIVHKLNECCSYEKKKSIANSKIYHNLYLLRNSIFNINPTTERRIIPSIYEDNLESLDEIINISKKKNVDLYFYIAPIRNDFKIPYNLEDYNSFKKFIKAISNKNKINFVNFEKIIPNYLWGTKPGTNLGTKKEIDFMHFQGPAHKILSENIFNFIESNDF